MPSNRFFMGNGIKNYFSGQPLNKLKKFKQNERPSECEYCWNAEAVNLKTHRINETQKWIKTDSHKTKQCMCNFKCRMCNPKFSSTWEIENRKHKFLEIAFRYKKMFLIMTLTFAFYCKSRLKKMNLKFINISGGEPLITDANFKLFNVP